MEERASAVRRAGLFSKAAGLIRKAAEVGIGTERAHKAPPGTHGSDGRAAPDFAASERRRRDREIRNQELDLLRELQAAQSEPKAVANSTGPDLHARASGGAGGNGVVAVPAVSNDAAQPQPSNGFGTADRDGPMPRRFVSGDLGVQPWAGADAAATEIEFPPTVVMEFGASQMLAAHLAEMGIPARSPILGDSWAAVVALAPEVEDAAMRFANGDAVGAEEKLQEALEGEAADDVMTHLALFDLYRATDQAEKFAAQATVFSQRTGLPAPAWMAIGDAGLASAAAASLPEDGDGVAGQILRLRLDGELRGDVAEVVPPTVQPGQVKVIELNCRALRRVDFGAGTTLIQWVTNQHHQGRRVGFIEVNWMVAAFLDLLGFGDMARVIRRTD